MAIANIDILKQSNHTAVESSNEHLQHQNARQYCLSTLESSGHSVTANSYLIKIGQLEKELGEVKAREEEMRRTIEFQKFHIFSTVYRYVYFQTYRTTDRSLTTLVLCTNFPND